MFRVLWSEFGSDYNQCTNMSKGLWKYLFLVDIFLKTFLLKHNLNIIKFTCFNCMLHINLSKFINLCNHQHNLILTCLWLMHSLFHYSIFLMGILENIQTLATWFYGISTFQWSGTKWISVEFIKFKWPRAFIICKQLEIHLMTRMGGIWLSHKGVAALNILIKILH